jgi:hypothetical protein
MQQKSACQKKCRYLDSPFGFFRISGGQTGNEAWFELIYGNIKYTATIFVGNLLIIKHLIRLNTIPAS